MSGKKSKHIQRQHHGYSQQERFVNRELSWLAFNQRVLEEASNPHHPVLERLRFLSISASNLDEFFMVRVAGLVGQANAGVEVKSQDDLTPAQQLERVTEFANALMDDQQKVLTKLLEEMRDVGIFVHEESELAPDQLSWLENYFLDQVLPVLTPLAIDPAHPFPFIPNLGFALALQLSRVHDNNRMNALLLIPQQLDRFILLPKQENSSELHFVRLETVVSLFIERTFPGYNVLGQGVFRIIRDSDIEVEEEAEDLVQLFESALKRRRRGKGRQILNTKPLRDRAKSVKCHQGKFIRLAFYAARGRHRLSQATKSALVINRQWRACRAAIADQTHGVRADIQNAQRRVRSQRAQPGESIGEFFCSHARHV